MKNLNVVALLLLVLKLNLAYFPAKSMAFDPKGRKIYVENLKVGDRILSLHSNATFFDEEIISIARTNPKKESAFIRIVYIDPSDKKTVRSIHISPTHLVIIGKYAIQSKFAKDIEVGDKIVIYLKGYVAVRGVDVVRKKGAYSPISSSGKMLVDGVLVSCYEGFPNHVVAHTAYSYFNKVVDNAPWIKGVLEKKWDERSISDYAVNGLVKFYKWWRGGGGENQDL